MIVQSDVRILHDHMPARSLQSRHMTRSSSHNANFQNPLGLLMRMLLSGKRAAYAALFHEALRQIARPIDSMLQRRDARLVESAPATDLPLLLVVGAPRSGTTLVYQTLARYLDVSYLTNLAAMFPRSPLTGSRLASRLPRRDSADFGNFYGQTARLHGPNDGFTLWNTWLGDDRYVPRTDLSDSEQQAMRTFFQAWSHHHGKPFLNKNNRNTACLDLLSRVLPQARFIVVRRNPLLVAQSLIRAREQVQGDRAVGWGLHSQSSDMAADPLRYVDDVCDQILEIERQLDEQLEHIAADRIVEITYEGFCEAPDATLRRISRECPGVALREKLMELELKPFEASATVTLTAAEQQRLLARLNGRRSASASRAAVAPR